MRGVEYYANTISFTFLILVSESTSGIYVLNKESFYFTVLAFFVISSLGGPIVLKFLSNLNTHVSNEPSNKTFFNNLNLYRGQNI